MRHRQYQKKPQRRSIIRQAPALVLGLFAVLVAGIYSVGGLPFVMAKAKGCNIKGNVSLHSREKIFHVVGQEDYDATVIRLGYGERWFCTEEEARAAGWRKARN